MLINAKNLNNESCAKSIVEGPGTTRKSFFQSQKKRMEEVHETQEILAGRELVQSIRLSKRGLKAGRTVQWEQLKRELRSKNKL